MKAENKQNLSVSVGIFALSSLAGILIWVLTKDISMGIFISILAYCIINIIHFIDECDQYKKK